MSAETEWTVVRRPQSLRQQRQRDVAAVERTCCTAAVALQSVAAWRVNLNKLSAKLAASIEPPVDLAYDAVVCYGLGCGLLDVHGAHSPSNLQAAVLCALGKDKPVFFYDPASTADDVRALSSLGWSPLAAPGPGGAPVRGSVLYFMPHCDRFLYCKVLDEHADVLGRLCIIGNSFNAYCSRSAAKVDDDAVARVTRNGSVVETPLLTRSIAGLDDTVVERAFSDTCWLRFHT